VAGRFPLYTDADVRGPLIKALRSAGWDIARAIDEMVEGAKDPQEARAQQWHEAKRNFPGLIVWRQAVYDQMTYGQLVDAFEELAQQADPFALYPIIRIWPKR
jgi:hypothetical protein